VLTNFFLSKQNGIGHDHGFLVTPRSFYEFDFFVVLAQVVGEGQRSFIARLPFGRVITALRKSVDHLLHGIVLSLPPVYVSVHVRKERARFCRLHFFGRYIVPSPVKLLQVWQKPFDHELAVCELFWGETAFAHVFRNGLFCDVLVVGVKLRGEESGNTLYGCVYR